MYIVFIIEPISEYNQNKITFRESAKNFEEKGYEENPCQGEEQKSQKKTEKKSEEQQEVLEESPKRVQNLFQIIHL